MVDIKTMDKGRVKQHKIEIINNGKIKKQITQSLIVLIQVLCVFVVDSMDIISGDVQLLEWIIIRTI